MTHDPELHDRIGGAAAASARGEDAQDRHARILRTAAIATYGRYYVRAEDCCIKIEGECWMRPNPDDADELLLELDTPAGTGARFTIEVSIDKLYDLRRIETIEHVEVGRA